LIAPPTTVRCSWNAGANIKTFIQCENVKL